MTKAPKKPNSRAKALAGMTKAELVRTVKQLDARQTKLLNEIAALESQVAQNGVAAAAMAEDEGKAAADREGRYWLNEDGSPKLPEPAPLFPWEQK